MVGRSTTEGCSTVDLRGVEAEAGGAGCCEGLGVSWKGLGGTSCGAAFGGYGSGLDGAELALETGGLSNAESALQTGWLSNAESAPQSNAESGHLMVGLDGRDVGGVKRKSSNEAERLNDMVSVESKNACWSLYASANA